MNTRKNSINQRHIRINPKSGSAFSLAGLAGGVSFAQAQAVPGYVPIEVLAVEQLQDGGLRVATPKGWAVLASDEWALADGRVMVRDGVVMHATNIVPWSKIGYSVGGVGLLAGAVLGGYSVIMDEATSSASSSAQPSTVAADTASDPANEATVVDDEPMGAQVPETESEAGSETESESQSASEPEVETRAYDGYFTGNTLIDSLLSANQEHWAGAGSFNQPTTVTFSFADQGSALSEEQNVSVQPIPDWFRAKILEQLEGIEAVANVDFVEVPDSGAFDAETGDGRGQINFALADDILPASFATLPMGDAPWLEDRNGDIVFSADMLDEGIWVDSYRGGAMTVTHEVLHALGLEHPFAGYLVSPDYVDTQFYSLLSYTSVQTDSYFPDAPMIADIAAIQHLYGANVETNTGDDTYAFDSHEVFLGTIWDAGGSDTIQHSGYREAVINLNAGQASRVGASPTQSNVYSVETIGFSDTDVIDRIVMDNPTDGWAEIRDDGQAFRLVHDPDTSDLDGDGVMPFTVYLESGQFERYSVDNDDVDVGLRDNLHVAEGVIIENAQGGFGNDVIIGNSSANRLDGGPGDDSLTGGAGADVFVFRFGFGDDVIQDFTVGEDRLDFSGLASGDAELVGQDTLITVAGEGTVTLENVDVTALMGTDELLV
ncbi:MAG: hypothetical protein CBC49_005470 [Alphaproteobacteria bacterium TMED89]|nr:hypothetical protein [Rhodospirillaceae bacterium]RPH15278.1 MAG: hypothetical protein CBC49_005470 [Alphaproteobacteria bacterium TMED89]